MGRVKGEGQGGLASWSWRRERTSALVMCEARGVLVRTAVDVFRTKARFN